jgi:uncharacterized protein YigE (DUF2233 family)
LSATAATRFRGLVVAWLLVLAACSGGEDQAPAGNDFDPAEFAGTPACEPRTFEGSAFTVCPFQSSKDQIRLAWLGADGQPLRSLMALEQSLGDEAKLVRFAMNAGMYDERGAPIGLFVAEGKERKSLNSREGGGNFHLLPNGVFAVDEKGRVSVTPTREFRKKVPSPHWATQSGPMLVIDGKLHPKFDPNGSSQLVRNGVGVCNPATAYFVISEEGVSFGRFARFFRDALGCRNALYLDGSVSSLWDPGGSRQDAYSELGPMIVVLRFSSGSPTRERPPPQPSPSADR